MNYTIKEMSKNEAIEISKWTYEKPYGIYDGERNKEKVIIFLLKA